MLNSKKALSPLIAAVLLIVVVVGIGAVITGIVRSTVAEHQETIQSKSDEMACARDVVISVLKVDGAPQICNGSNYVYAILENTGSVAVDDFQLKVFGTTGFHTNDSVNDTMNFVSGSSLEFIGGFADVGTIEQVKLVPKLKKSGQSGYHYCSEVALTYDGIETC